jgi:hypothetical protein
MAVDGDAVDLIDAQRAGGKRRHRDRRGDDGINLLKYVEERRTQAVAAIAGLDIVNAAVGRALRHDVAVVAVGGCQRAGVAGRHGRRLLGVGDRLQDSLEHIRCELDAVGHDGGPERPERLDRRLERVAHIGSYRRIAEVGAASDPDAVELSRRRIEAVRRHRQARGIGRSWVATTSRSSAASATARAMPQLDILDLLRPDRRKATNCVRADGGASYSRTGLENRTP